MFAKKFVLLCGLVGGALAHRNETCGGKCAEAVLNPWHHGSKGCQSYYGTATVTAANLTQTLTVTQTANQTFLQTSTEIDSTTLLSTIDNTASATVSPTTTTSTTTTTSQFFSVTSTDTVTITITSISTSISTAVTVVPAKKRAVPTGRLTHEILPEDVEKRDQVSESCVTKVYTTVFPVTTVIPVGPQSSISSSGPSSSSSATSPSSSSSIGTCSAAPWYASACHDCADYTSACSCVGVTGTTTTTVPGKTLTLTQYQTLTSNVIESFTTTTGVTSISDIPVTTTLTSTQIITQVSIITEITSITSSFSAEVTTSTSTTSTTSETFTSTSTMPACTSFYLQVTDSSASVNNQYVTLSGSDDETITDESFTTDTSGAAVFTIDSSGHLFNGGLQANTDSTGLATVYFNNPGEFPGSPAITCSLNQGVGGQLSCTGYEASATLFQLCPDGCSTGAEPCGGVALGTSDDSRCTPLSFNTVSAC